MRIGKPDIAVEGNTVVYRTEIESEDGHRELWFRIDAEFGDLVTDTCDAPLVGLLIPAMAAGEDIHLSGAISERLYYNLSAPCQSVFRNVIPTLRAISLRPSELLPGRKPAAGVAAGFTGGIDSFCVLADHHYSPDCPEGFRLTHLVLNNVGSHGHGAEGTALFEERCARLTPVAERTGLPLVRVDSNLDSFYGEGLGFLQTHTPRLLSAALVLQRGLGRYISASTFNYSDVYVGPARGTGLTEPITLPLLSTEVIDLLSVGHIYTRPEKTIKVAEIADSYEVLDVCMKSGSRNCSQCKECLRTLITLDIAGLLDRYSDRFYIDKYRANRNKLLARFLQNKPRRGALRREVLEFAKKSNWRIPLSVYLNARRYRIGNTARKKLRWLKRIAQHTGKKRSDGRV